MAKYLRLFDEHIDYEAAESSLILPNVSFCIDTPNEVHYNPYIVCEETSVYEVVGVPSYPATVDGADTSFDITVNYRRTDTDTACTDTVTEGTDTVTVEIGANPSSSNTRTVTGTVDYYGNEIEYSVTQSKFEAKVTAKFNVTDTSSPTKIASGTSSFSSIEIDGVEQPSVSSGYTFDTTGEHTIKYTLKDPTIIAINALRDCSSLTSVTIPDSVISIGDYAFRDCSSLTSIDIPDSVTSIGNQVFRNCSGLTSCTIGSGVTSIGQAAFRECSSLSSITVDNNNTAYDSRNNCNAIIETSTNVLILGCKNTVIPNTVTSIGGRAFFGATNLISIDIPNSVTSIGDSAFQCCTSLTSIIIPDSVTSIGNSAFYSATSLTSIDIPNSVTSMDDSVFNKCISLTTATIGSGVTSIGSYTFAECRGLTSVTIPDSVTSIGNSAFTYCTSLSNITCNATTAPTIQNNTFYNVKTNGTLYVPQGSTGYNVWMETRNYYLGKYYWKKVEQ